MFRIAACSLALVALLGSAPADDGGWSMDDPPEAAPTGALAGSIFGRDLGEHEVTYGGIGITIRSKEKIGGWPASEVILFVNEKDIGETITVTPKSDGMLPHIHMKTAIEGRSFPGTLMYTEMYSMRLETKEQDGTLVGSIHLSLPDYQKTHLVGTFTAKQK